MNEMYDQLARYGNGDMGVLANGNAAGAVSDGFGEARDLVFRALPSK